MPRSDIYFDSRNIHLSVFQRRLNTVLKVFSFAPYYWYSFYEMGR